MTAATPFPVSAATDPVARFEARAIEVRANLAIAADGADPCARFEIAGLLATLAYYEKLVAARDQFSAGDAEHGLQRFGRNGYAPLIDVLAARGVRRGGVDWRVRLGAARAECRA